MAIYIGTSGWSYDHWEGILYPPKSSSTKRLEYYLRRFRTVEVNNTHYRWPRDETFARWREQLPAGFLMSVKASKGLTHFRRLNHPEEWLERMEGGLRQLGDRRGVLLLQLPARFGFDLGRLEQFLAACPTGSKLTMEFRSPTWDREETYAALERHQAAYCVMSGPGMPCVLRATAPFVYVRLHGPDPWPLYAGCYSDDDLRWWADRIREWVHQGRDVFAYFNNDGYGHAVRNADTLQHLLG